ncbi:hypothetical protein CPC08DRAFT_813199 [Agrocybe pediades]|nr:hypothetical protein CPC08DRAFT_813199 [Agrocybe pediades]
MLTSSMKDNYVNNSGSDSSKDERGLRLTLANLSAVPVRDKGEFLKAYLQSQKRFVKEYMPMEQDKEGETSSDKPQATVGSASDHAIRANIFSTPVLKPRVYSVDFEALTAAPAHALPSRVPAGSIEAAKPTKQASKSRQTPSDTVQINTKLSGPSGSLNKNPMERGSNRQLKVDSLDDEATQRNNQRRQRKRAKRNILQPPEPTTCPDSDLKTKSTSKRKNQDKQKVPAGFALMHGFSATNLGKKRLTLDPSERDVGVFKKGKASGVAVTAKKTSKPLRNTDFSEAKFLNSKKRRAESSTASSITLSEDESSFREAQVKGRRLPKAAKTGPDTVVSEAGIQGSSEPPAPTRLPYDPANSVVWDIEMDSNMSTPQSADPAKTMGGSVTVKMPTIQKTKGDQTCNPEQRAGSEVSLNNDPRSLGPQEGCSSLSLGPSQSASQAGLPLLRETRHSAIPADKSSKYFEVSVEHDTPSHWRIESDDGKEAGTYDCQRRLQGHGIDPSEDALEPVLEFCRSHLANNDVAGDSLALNCQSDVLLVPHSETEETSISCVWLSMDTCNSDDLGSLYGEFRNPPINGTDAQIIGTNEFWVDSDVDYGNAVLYSGSEMLTDCFGELPSTQSGNALPCLQEGQLLRASYGSNMECCDLDPLLDAESMCDSQGQLYPVSESSMLPICASPFLICETTDYEDGCDDEDEKESEFRQGRLLLLGLQPSFTHAPGINGLRKAEEEVATGLRARHWLPQRL